MNVGGMVRRLVATWSKAGAAVRADGLDWYPKARWTVDHLAAKYQVPRERVAGVISALSPRLQWGTNLRAAEVVLKGKRPSGVFGTSYLKAQRIAQGADPREVLGGPKTRAFYWALLGDNSQAVVDAWVIKLVGWDRSVKARAYNLIARALRIAAAKVGIAVASFQAVVWVAIRGRAA